MFFLIIFLPLLGVIGGCLFGRQLGKGIIPYTILNIFLPCLFSIVLLLKNFLFNSIIVTYLNLWFSCGSLIVSWELLGDNLTFSMVFVVTFISLLVHIYSCEYMGSDPHLTRFLSYLSLFTFFMLILVTLVIFFSYFWVGRCRFSVLFVN